MSTCQHKAPIDDADSKQGPPTNQLNVFDVDQSSGAIDITITLTDPGISLNDLGLYVILIGDLFLDTIQSSITISTDLLDATSLSVPLPFQLFTFLSDAAVFASLDSAPSHKVRPLAIALP